MRDEQEHLEERTDQWERGPSRRGAPFTSLGYLFGGVVRHPVTVD
jgi:hypothetical protein